MIQLLAALVAVGIVLSIFTGLIGLVIAVPAALALLLVLRNRQPRTKVDDRFLGGPQPDSAGGPDDSSGANPHEPDSSRRMPGRGPGGA